MSKKVRIVALRANNRVDMDAENCGYHTMEFPANRPNANLRDSGRNRKTLVNVF